MSVEIPVIHEKDAAQPVTVSEAIFGYQFNEPLIHQLVTGYLANGRAGTKAQKNRSAVRGGGKKPWRQKGTGRARSGSIRSPIWRGGGVTFAAVPGRKRQKLNKGMYRIGMRSILSELLRQNRLAVSKDIVPEEPKTKAIVNKLKQYDLTQRVLILVEQENPVLEMAVRNVINVQVSEASRVDPVSLISADKVLMTEEAAKLLEERLG